MLDRFIFILYAVVLLVLSRYLGESRVGVEVYYAAGTKNFIEALTGLKDM
jgi:hypothetical protein